MSNRTIYDTLRAAGLTAEGACALMGNMMAESTMKSNIAQRGMTNLSDEDYTALADNGIPVNGKDFANDGVGYGLCQWTYHTRKAALLAFCKNLGVSVSDEHAQVLFCLQELQRDYPMLLLDLRSSHDLYRLVAEVCTKYERPAVNNVEARYQYALEFFNEFCGSGALADEHAAMNQSTAPTSETPSTGADFGKKIAIIFMQMIMSFSGYWGDVTGENSDEFRNAASKFVEDMTT